LRRGSEGGELGRQVPNSIELTFDDSQSFRGLGFGLHIHQEELDLSKGCGKRVVNIVPNAGEVLKEGTKGEESRIDLNTPDSRERSVQLLRIA
jgi:hypothetical protein